MPLVYLIFLSSFMLEIIGCYMAISWFSVNLNLIEVSFFSFLEFFKIIGTIYLCKKWNKLQFFTKIFSFIILLFIVFMTSYCSYCFLIDEFNYNKLIELNTLVYMANIWNTTIDFIFKTISIMISLIVDPLALMMLTLGWFLMLKNSNFTILKIKPEFLSENDLFLLVEKNKQTIINLDFLNKKTEIINIPVEQSIENYIDKMLFEKDLFLFSKKINQKPIDLDFSNKKIEIINIPVEQSSENYVDDSFWDVNSFEIIDYSEIINYNFFVFEDADINSIEMINTYKENVSVSTKKTIRKNKNSNHAKKNNNISIAHKVIEEIKDCSDYDRIDRYVKEKYGMTQEEVASIERPGDYLLEGW